MDYQLLFFDFLANKEENMGFFKDFKNDMKQAVNELIPGNDEMVSEYDDEDMVNTLEEPQGDDEAYVNTLEEEPKSSPAEEEDLEDIDLSDLEDFEMDEADLDENDTEPVVSEENTQSMDVENDKAAFGYTDDMDSLADLLSGHTTIEEIASQEITTPDAMQSEEHSISENISEVAVAEDTASDFKEATAEQELQEETNNISEQSENSELSSVEQEEETMTDDKIIEITAMKEIEEPVVEEEKETEPTSEMEISDSTTYITKGTRIEGNLFTDGSVDIIGTVEGDVNCYGKLVVSGAINGKVNASEIYANAAKITGEITSAGSVKIGVGSVIVGNVEAQSAVIAGAVNGDLDVKGPVIVDSTAVIMGNIKSRSVQINNGAVIEGFCSQCYSDIDVKSFFA